MEIRNTLEKLSLTHAWSLRETDLWSYQRQLDRIDEARVDGNFLDDLGRPAELYEQRVSYFTYPNTTSADIIVDIAIPPAEELCYHLPLDPVLRTRFGSPTTDLQPAYHPAKMLA